MTPSDFLIENAQTDTVEGGTLDAFDVGLIVAGLATLGCFIFSCFTA